MELKDVIPKLESSKEFKDWQESHKEAFLAHAFVMLEEPREWQIGYFGGKTMTTFVLQGDSVKVIPDQEVLKAQSGISKLNIDDVKISIDKALEISDKYPKEWRGDETGSEKDLVCLTDGIYSIEIKASSNPKKIFGNRSYAQQTESGSKKGKSGYYLAINFKKFDGKTEQKPELVNTRFGWIDHTDWRGQSAPSGQQANLSSDVEKFKLLSI